MPILGMKILINQHLLKKLVKIIIIKAIHIKGTFSDLNQSLEMSDYNISLTLEIEVELINIFISVIL